MNTWVKGVIAAFITGAMNGFLAVQVFDIPIDEFGAKVGWFTLLSGLVGLATYLKQSPIPKDE